MFLQMHTLTSFHASLLNRDDAGLAKRIPFGDEPRLRISSQCLKRHWREALQDSLALPDGIRSREFFSRVILPRLVEEKGVDDGLARNLTETLMGKLIAGGLDKGNPLFMKQPALFGKPEADFFVALLAECAGAGDAKAAKDLLAERLKTDKKGFKALLRQAGHGNLYAGFEGALFGRFVTSDILARSDAAVHVAHAFTVHPMETEVDYFTVVDDLNKDEETGAAHAGDMELGGGLFYGYVAVDIPLLVSNFTACEPKMWRDQDSADAEGALGTLLNAIATVSPGAKLGATAPYARADFVLFESGAGQPRSLANAYLQSLQFSSGDDPMQRAVNALGEHLQAVDGMYGAAADQRAAATFKDGEALGGIPVSPLNSAIDETLNAIFRG
ncbi:MAG: type I-E CRISPR-associated protein Cas7/Cse4/CasC [Candidatus Thiodiazotropha sp. (ex Epidulcina cf. delphinae)]|nr:type I-E CRISPR-associated protein Cas7/Cse4/CasC [Candidatus Thiodiazotropha sp. (ex Epidulcina cf. delphinae)]